MNLTNRGKIIAIGEKYLLVGGPRDGEEIEVVQKYDRGVPTHVGSKPPVRATKHGFYRIEHNGLRWVGTWQEFPG